MQLRTLLTAGTTAVLLGVLPMAAMAQDTSDDPETDGTFVPSGPSDTESEPASTSESGTTSDPETDGTFVPTAPSTTSTPSPETGVLDSSTDTGATDELPNTGGGLALAGGAAMAGAALLRTRRG